MAEFDQVTELLTDVPFPVTKEQLVLHAKTEGADEDMLNDLRTLPDRDYADLMDVWHGLGAIRSSEAEVEPSEPEETSATSWVCPNCELRFSEKSDYLSHMRDEHGESVAHSAIE